MIIIKKDEIKDMKRSSSVVSVIISALLIVTVIAVRSLGGLDTVQKIHLGILLVVPVFLINRCYSRRYGYLTTLLSAIVAFTLSGIVSDPGSLNFFMLSVLVSVMLLITFIVQKDRRNFEKIKEFSLMAPDPDEIKDHYNMEVVDALLRAVDAKDSYTYNHSKRVAYYARKLAISAGLPKDESDKIYIAAMLHDIGKIGMKDSILNKTDRLSDMEYVEAKEHVVVGARIATNLENLKEVVPMMLHHHERYDGKGYPEQLKGEDIPVGARIIAISDSFDAMTSDREYRKGMSVEEAAKRLMEAIGTQYDPQLCLIFAEMIRNKSVVHPDITV